MFKHSGHKRPGLLCGEDRILSGLYNLAFEEIRYTDSIQLTAFKENVLKVLHNPDMKKTFEDFINPVINLSGEALGFTDLFTCARHTGDIEIWNR